jgi:hypothetical protein
MAYYILECGTKNAWTLVMFQKSMSAVDQVEIRMLVISLCYKYTTCQPFHPEKNISHHRILGRSPYRALFSTEPKVDLSSTNLPAVFIQK